MEAITNSRLKSYILSLFLSYYYLYLDLLDEIITQFKDAGILI